MTFHAKPLAAQPALDEYVGTYRRPPLGTVEVRLEGHARRRRPATRRAARRCFYGPDVAFATAGAYAGSPYEFIRTRRARGVDRVNGRIARKDRSS